MVFYRFDVRVEDGIFGEFNLYKLKLNVYYLNRETHKGYWISINEDAENPFKWIPKKSRKRFAYPTVQEALESFKLRTEKRINILNENLNMANFGLAEIERNQEDIKNNEFTKFL